MRVLHKRIEHGSVGDEFKLIPLGDIHAGASACDEKLVQKAVQRIKDTGAFWIGMGDMADSIGRHDKRYREASLAPWLHGCDRLWKAQREWLVEALKPIGERCIGYLVGNHENHVEATLGVDMSHSIIEAIAPTTDTQSLYGDMESLIVLDFAASTGKPKPHVERVVIYAHHGFGGGDLMGGAALKLDRLPAAVWADVFVMGHVHKRMAFEAVALDVDKNARLIARNLKLAYTGTFLKSRAETFPTYAEEKGLRARPLGWVEFTLRPHVIDRDRRIEVTI